MRVSLRLQIALILLALTALTAVLVGIPVLNLLERALAEGVPQAVAEQLSRARFLISLYALLAAVIVVLVGFVLLSRLVVDRLVLEAVEVESTPRRERLFGLRGDTGARAGGHHFADLLAAERVPQELSAVGDGLDEDETPARPGGGEPPGHGRAEAHPEQHRPAAGRRQVFEPRAGLFYHQLDSEVAVVAGRVASAGEIDAERAPPRRRAGEGQLVKRPAARLLLFPEGAQHEDRAGRGHSFGRRNTAGEERPPGTVDVASRDGGFCHDHLVSSLSALCADLLGDGLDGRERLHRELVVLEGDAEKLFEADDDLEEPDRVEIYRLGEVVLVSDLVRLDREGEFVDDHFLELHLYGLICHCSLPVKAASTREGPAAPSLPRHACNYRTAGTRMRCIAKYRRCYPLVCPPRPWRSRS